MPTAIPAKPQNVSPSKKNPETHKVPAFVEKDFKEPGHRYRPAPFWSWNADLEEEELVRQIRDMKEKGWGGYFMHSRVGLITPYLSKKWFDCVKACLKEAAATGTDAWLYDEDKWPSGFAGGIVPEMGKTYRLKVLKAIHPEELDKENDEVLAKIQRPEGEVWIVKHTAPLGNAWFNGASYVDMMNPEVVKKFLEVTVDGYKKEVGEHFGKEIPGIFTDEPCYTMFNQFRGMLPWTDGLPDFFQKLKGYKIEDHFAELFFASPGSVRTRFDFFDAATRLFRESFTRQYYEKCEANNLIFTGHFMAEDSLESQTQWVGAAMPHYEFMHWPGIDKLARHVKQTVTVKQLSSVAEQLGKERIFSEVFGVNGQQFDFRGRRWIHNWEAALGVNFVNHHLSLYTMMGERKRDYPPNFFYQQPYWEDERGLSDYFGRLSYLLTRGERQIETLILHPIGSQWAEYDVLTYLDPNANHLGWAGIAKSTYDAPFKTLTDHLLARRLDFHYGDEIIMERHASVDGKNFRIGRCSYQTVVIPPSLTWRTSTLALIEEFAANGGHLIFVGETPTLVDAHEPLDCQRKFPKASFVKTNEKASELIRKNTSFIQIENIPTGKEVDEIFIHSRKLEDGRIVVFLTNTHETKVIESRITLPWLGAVERVSCDNGQIVPAEVEVRGNAMALEHTFFGGDAVMFLIDPKAKPVQKSASPKTGKNILLTEWKGQALEDNMLRIDEVSLWLAGKKVLENAPIHRAWDEHFYAAEDGTPFEAEYRFQVDEKPEGSIRAIIEMAQHLSGIQINGVTVKPDGKNWHGDFAMTTVDITTSLKTGENRIHLSGKKINNITCQGCHRRVKENEFPYKNTEVESIFIVGDFAVRSWENRDFRIIKKAATPLPLADITGSGYPFYAGNCAYTSSFTLVEKCSKVRLEFSEVCAPSVRAKVNGKNAGAVLWDPFALDITALVKTGANEIEIAFPTDLFNLMGPNTAPLGLPEGVSPATFRFDAPWSRELLLLRRGIGGVRLVLE